MLACYPCLLAAVMVIALGTTARGDLVNPFRHASASGQAEQIATPEADDGEFLPMRKLGVDISLPKGEVPTGVAEPRLVTTPLAGQLPRPWPTLTYHWKAPGTFHQPLYFEEINAERYGYSCNWVAQPFISTAHFFGTIPALPYLKGANCPWECQYTLGHYRAGSCPPDRFHCWPVSRLGALSEVGNAAWLIVVLP